MFLIEYIKKYKVTYISVVATFLIGICIGIFVTFKIPEKDREDVNNYLQDMVQIVKEKNIDKQNIFKEKLIENFKDIRNNMDFRMYHNCQFYNLYFYDLQGNIIWLHNNNSPVDTWIWKWNKVSCSYCNRE